MTRHIEVIPIYDTQRNVSIVEQGPGRDVLEIVKKVFPGRAWKVERGNQVMPLEWSQLGILFIPAGRLREFEHPIYVVGDRSAIVNGTIHEVPRSSNELLIQAKGTQGHCASTVVWAEIMSALSDAAGEVTAEGMSVYHWTHPDGYGSGDGSHLIAYSTGKQEIASDQFDVKPNGLIVSAGCFLRRNGGHEYQGILMVD